MKKLIVLFFLCCSSINCALADNRYEKEIKLIEKNTADFIALSEKKLAELDEILAAWTQLEEYSNELTAIIKLRVHSVSANADESIKQLQAYNDEKTYVENTLVGLSVQKPKIEAVIKNITKLLDNVPSIKEKCQIKLENVLASLNEQEENLNARKVQVDLNLDKWRLWQLEIATEVQTKNQYEVMNHLEVVQTLDQISGAFSLLNINFYLAMKNHEYEDAENILQGYAWLKSVFPFYFSDKINTQDQYELQNQIIAKAESEQQEMTAMLERFAERSIKSRTASFL